MRRSLLLAFGGIGVLACAETSSFDDQTGAVKDPGTPNPGGGQQVPGPPPVGESPGATEPVFGTEPPADVVAPATDDSPLVPSFPTDPTEPLVPGDDGPGDGEQQGTQTGDQGSGGSPSFGGAGPGGGAGGGASCDPPPELLFPEQTRWTGTLSAPGEVLSAGDGAGMELAFTDPGTRECTIDVDAALTFTSDGLSYTTNVELWIFSDGAARAIFTVPASAVTPERAVPPLDAFEPVEFPSDPGGQAGVAGEQGGAFSGPGGVGGAFGTGGLGGAPPNASTGPGGAGLGPAGGAGGAIPQQGGAGPRGASGGSFTRAATGGLPWLLETAGAPAELECWLPNFQTTDADPVGISLRGDLSIDSTMGTSALELVWLRRDEDGSTWYSVAQGCAQLELETE